MARGVRMGVGGSTSARRYLYNKGVIGTLFVNPAKWWPDATDNANTIAAQFLSDKIYCPITTGKLYGIGTSNPIDFSLYTSLHIKAKRLDTLSNDLIFAIDTSKSFATRGLTYQNVNSQALNEYVIDTSSITVSAYVKLFTTSYNIGFEVESIWLE